MTAFRGNGGTNPAEIFIGRRGRSLGARIVPIVLAVLLLALGFASITSVPSGHVGVLTLFGRVTGEILPEGIHVVNPLKRNNVLSIRTQEKKETAQVPSSEGLIVSLDTSLLFRLDTARAAEVFQKIGPRYVEIVVEPNLRSTIRAITGANSANALYSSGRNEVQDAIEEELTGVLGARGIVVEDVLLRDVQLPEMLRSSIEQKQQAEQESLRMGFILEKEAKEAERKRIEAQGISDFQRIVSQGISQQLLQWKGIEATEKLAASANTKIVVIGSGKDGLPIILGNP